MKNQIVSCGRVKCLRHRYEPCYKEDPTYLYMLEQGNIKIPESDEPNEKFVYTGKKCISCGDFIARREGSFTQICRRDGESMKLIGTRKRWGTWIKVYQCSNKKCRHKSYTYTTAPIR